jgi:hypothetical protein
MPNSKVLLLIVLCSDWRGYDASRTLPLATPQHPLNGDWKGAIDTSEYKLAVPAK